MTPQNDSGQPPVFHQDRDATLRRQRGIHSQDGDAGTKSIEGVNAVGTKTTRTIEAGTMGNERPIVS